MLEVAEMLSALTRQMGRALNEAQQLENDASSLLPRTPPTVRKTHRRHMPNPQELCNSEQAELSGKKVAGGRWGSSERFKANKQDAEVGPGHYQPDISKVVRRTPGARICPPTRKNLAAHLNEFQKLLEKSEVGPGKYSPQYFATSEWVSTHAPCIPQPRIASTARVIQTHDCEALDCKSQCSSHAISEKSLSDRKSVGCLKWMPDYFPERSVQHTPGPGSYDPLYQFVSERIPGSSWQRSSLSSNGKLSQAILSHADDIVPGPGSYDVKTDLLFRRSSSALIVSSRQLETSEDESWGDKLILQPNFSLVHPRIRCSVTYREPSVLSLASTERAASTSSVPSLDSSCLSILSTKRRSLSYSFCKGVGSRNQSWNYKTIGPSDYMPNYTFVSRRTASCVISRAHRGLLEKEQQRDLYGDVLCIDPETSYKTTVKTQPRIVFARHKKPSFFSYQTSYLGPNDSGVLVGKLADCTPSIDMSRTSARASASKDEDARLGPGYYYVDDTLTARRVPTAFISPPAPEDEVEEDREGDRLVLETSAADEMTRRRVVMMVDIGRQMGREEATRRDRAPEALDYNPEVPRDIRGFSMATQSSRKENDQGGEGSHLLNKYQASYSLVENSGRAYSIGKSKRTREDGGEEEDRGGDVLILDTNKGWEYLRVRHGIVEFGKLTGRVSEIIESSDPSQDLVDWEGPRGVAEKTLGFVDFSRMTARKEPFSATTSAVLGPGAYEIQDHLLFRDCFHISFGRQSRFSEDKFEDDEGDRLVLYPERAESLIRPNIPSFTFIFQPSALVSEWASKTIFVRGHGGELFELPSIGSRVRMKQLSDIFSAWRRPDFYEIKETLTRKSCFQKTLVDIGKASNVRKVDIGMKLRFDDTMSTSLPIVKQIHKGGLLDKAGSIQKGDKIVKIVGKNGRTMDLHRWAMKSRNKGASYKLPADTSNQVNYLGPWRECVISSPGTSTRSRTEQPSFFFNVETKEKLWSFDVWSRKDEVVRNIMQEIEELHFPITIHFRRHQSHCTLQVLVENFQDFLYGAYDPKYELVERDLQSVSDFVTANGRESSLEAKARMRLFQKNMTLSALKSLPTHLAAPPSEATNRDFTSQKLALRDKHERMFRSLREKHKQEAEEIDGEEAESLKHRHSQERKSLRKKIRREEEALERSLQKQQLISLDKSEIEREISKIVLQQHLELDAGARLRETERQRRVRFAPENEALLHTAAYSQAAPAGKKWIQKGKSHACPDARGLTDQEVQDWKLHTEYRGFSESDDLVKWFWQLMESWSPRRRAETLQLATGTAAAPRGGFGCLFGHDIKHSDRPIPFSIRRIAERGDKKEKQLRSFPPLNRLYLPE